jgi:hypothetical protein
MQLMVVFGDDGASGGGPAIGEVLDYVQTMALQLAMMCEDAGAMRVALRLREAAVLAAGAPQPPEENAAPGDAA